MLFAMHISRRPLCCLLAVGALALFGAGRANAGYAVAPNGQSFPVTVDSNGYLNPTTIDLVVYLDALDSSPYVWVAETPDVGPSGSPVSGAVGSCSSSSLIPFGEPNKWVCRASTTLMKPNRTYYWWLSFRRQDPGQPAPTDRVSGPFSFSFVQQETPPPVEEPPVVPPVDPHAGVSTKTVAAAATLPSSVLFTGSRSIKHTTLTRLVYKTMKRFGLPRSLAFACWNRLDWVSVLAAEGAEPTSGGSSIHGFWQSAQPRWLHLAPGVCADVQGLLSTKKPNARRAGALTTVIHETLHAYGVQNEAQTNCWAVQLVPYFGVNLGMTRARSDYLGTLARNYVRARSPANYWHAGHCRDGGAWDLFPWRNLR